MQVRVRSMLYLFACLVICYACLTPVIVAGQSIAPGVGRMNKSGGRATALKTKKKKQDKYDQKKDKLDKLTAERDAKRDVLATKQQSLADKNTQLNSARTNVRLTMKTEADVAASPEVQINQKAADQAKVEADQADSDAKQAQIAMDGAQSDADKAKDELTTAQTNVGTAQPDDTKCEEPSHWYLPTSKLSMDESSSVQCFYNSNQFYSVASKVEYVYNPAGSANTVSGNILSGQSDPQLGGFQLALVGNASSSTCTPASSTTPTNAGVRPLDTAGTAASSTCGTAGSDDNSNSPSLQQAIQSLEKGGDFGLQGVWPFLDARSTYLQVIGMLTPKAGFTVNGLTDQNTVSNATEANFFIPVETYAQLDLCQCTDATDNKFSFYADYRGGLESTSSAFAQNAKLGHHNFGMQFLAIGIVINGSVRISGQRYFGPKQAFVDSSGNQVTADNFKGWQMGIQFTPTNLKPKSQQ